MTKFTQMAANEDDGASRRRIHLREISDDAPLETVGQDLRAARIRRGDDLAAVSRALKIRKDHLDALESDRLDALPGKTYAIGFIRSYARHLGLDANVLVERFKAEVSGRGGDDQMLQAAMLHDDETRRLPQGWRILAGIIGVALLWGVWHIFFSGRDAAPPVPPPPVLAPTVARIAEPPRPAAPPPVEIAPGPSATAPLPAATTQPPPAAPVPAPRASNAGVLAATQAVVEPAVPPAPASGQVYGQQNRGNSRVLLRARAATRITVRGEDGRLFINRDLAPGEVYYVPNLPGLSLAVADAGAVEANLDGRPLGRVGQQGQVVGRVSLDPESLIDRFNTR